MFELVSWDFGKNYHTYTLQASGGTACTRPHQHDDGKQPPQDGCPLHVVICRKTGGCMEGDYLEQGFAEGFFHPHGTGIVKYDGYDGSEEHNWTEIEFQLGIADELLEFPVDEQ